MPLVPSVSSTTSKLFFFSAVFFLLSNSAIAKDSIEISSSADFEAPNIEHDLNKDISRDEKGGIVVQVKVTDEFSVNSVSLFFRDTQNNKYRKRPMLSNAKAGKDIYQASIPAESVSGDRIEYYFEADDKVGNKKLKGLEFSPLKMELAKLGFDKKQESSPATSKVEKIAEQKPTVSNTAAATPQEETKNERDQPLTSTDFPMVWIPGL